MENVIEMFYLFQIPLFTAEKRKYLELKIFSAKEIAPILCLIHKISFLEPILLS